MKEMDNNSDKKKTSMYIHRLRAKISLHMPFLWKERCCLFNCKPHCHDFHLKDIYFFGQKSTCYYVMAQKYDATKGFYDISSY